MQNATQLPPDQTHQRIPIHVITGFLGSGKTRLLNLLLKQDAMHNTAVIVNEFGDISIDHLLVQTATEDIMRLAGGCLCCSVRTDLVQTLEQLFRKRKANDAYHFSQVVIETSGLADPAPILRTLLNDEFVAGQFRLENVVTTVDTVYGAAHLQEYEESVKQVALANHLILTKTDLPQADSASLLPRLRQLNPAAHIHNIQQTAPTAQTLFASCAYATQELDAAAWLQADLYNTLASHDHAHDHAPPHDLRYEDYIRSFCLDYDKPLSWKVLERWIQQLTHLRGKDLLRIKGIAYTQETDLPVVIQGVQHILQPPTTLSKWHTKPRTQIVFITRNISQLQVEKSLNALLQSQSPQDVCVAAMILLSH